MYLNEIPLKGYLFYIIMWFCPGNMPKYYPGLKRHITWTLAIYYIALASSCNMIYCSGQYSCNNPINIILHKYNIYNAIKLKTIYVDINWRVICLSDLGNILAYYLDKTTLISLLY
jgi:hypothetical protein